MYIKPPPSWFILCLISFRSEQGNLFMLHSLTSQRLWEWGLSSTHFESESQAAWKSRWSCQGVRSKLRRPILPAQHLCQRRGKRHGMKSSSFVGSSHCSNTNTKKRNLTTVQMCQRTLTGHCLNCQKNPNKNKHQSHHTDWLADSCRHVTDLLGSRCSWSPGIWRCRRRDPRYERHLCLSRTPSCHHTFRNNSECYVCSVYNIKYIEKYLKTHWQLSTKI